MTDPTSETGTRAEAVPSCTAFLGSYRIASGDLRQVALAAKHALDADPWATLLVFHDDTAARIELDLRGTDEEILARLKPALDEDASPPSSPSGSPQGPGRPKLGVVAREVTLLPRHWDWLNQQPGGASVALRRLVEEARRASAGRDRIRQSQEATYRFLSAMAGNLPGFEEATRALFAGDGERFDALLGSWPPDIRDHAQKMAATAFERGTE